MQQVSVFLPDELVVKMKILIPQQEYSHFFIQLLERELQIREAALYQTACEVEADETLNQEMSDWNVTIADGIQHESW
ncbi:MAG: hypothetical protein VSS75_022190 [Candidatus Parabeggiatoa sp.]|nr:hypothetical protein [Candidatus Parabeggiatoa sp.]